MDEDNDTPPPGTHEAIVKGCTCPVIDNAYGRGYMGQPGIYVFTVGCPVHWPDKPASDEKQEKPCQDH